jgi:hemerythrin-like domain-containing protein
MTYRGCMSQLGATRRQFLIAGGAAALAAPVARAEAKHADDVPPTEDLMREHGVLRRILLIYGEAARRLDAKQPLEPAILTGAATIIREFIEDYHEKDEEELVFPRLRKAGKLDELIAVLIAQHQAGRRLTEQVLKLAPMKSDGDRRPLVEALRSFARMYEPHAAREDTVLFPAFRELLTERELKKLQDVFEDKEKALPHGGFETVVAEVAKLERPLGLYDLASFTPA